MAHVHPAAPLRKGNGLIHPLKLLRIFQQRKRRLQIGNHPFMFYVQSFKKENFKIITTGSIQGFIFQNKLYVQPSNSHNKMKRAHITAGLWLLFTLFSKAP